MSDTKNDNPSFNYKSTPPPNNRKVRNPFDKALIDRLHKPICSPGMCKIYKKKHTGTFRWDIDQACNLVPADIVACNSQFEASPADEALERIAEEATEKFFSQEMVMPSPLIDTSKKVKPLLLSSDASIEINCSEKEQSTVTTRDVSAQTVLTLPPELPPEIEKILAPFCTFTQDQDISGEYEITANGSFRRKLFFEEHSDMEHYDSEQTDDEIHVEPRPPSSYEAHTPVTFSPDLVFVGKGLKRTFGTPLKKGPTANKPCYRNKILDVVDFGEACPFSPIEFTTPKRTELDSATSSSLASVSISPVNKATPSDEEKNNFTSPESEVIATCLNCVAYEPDGDKPGPCFCKITPNKIILKRSKSLKESPPRSRKGSFSMSEKRSLSMTSLHRSRSVQKLDFSMNMSVDGSVHDNSQDSEYSSAQEKDGWSIVEEATVSQLVKVDSAKAQMREIRNSAKLQSVTILDETPIKGRTITNVRTHEISKIRVAMPLSPLEMSLDNSLDNFDNPLSLEDKKIDFNTVDLKFLTENVSQFEYTASNVTKVGDEVSPSFKRIDSGFNENTFYTNASSYYESAIKPSELTVTNVSKTSSKNALKEISNVHWMRIDSGFKDENSADSMQFYNETRNETQTKKFTSFQFSEAKLDNKENTEDFDGLLVQSSNKHDAMSMSDIFTDDMTFNCNFSSTPSKNKSRKANS